MARKRKNELEGDGSRSRKSSNGNDAKKKRKLDQVKTKPQPSSSSTEALAGGIGDASWSKSKKKRMRNLKSKLLKKQDPTSVESVKAVNGKNAAPTPASSPKEHQQQNVDKTASKTDSSEKQTSNSLIPPPPPRLGQSSALQQAFQARLSGSRFRILNEELYTTTSSTAFERFSAHPELYDEYHDGFRSQVEHWPVNPVDVIVGRLKKEVDVFVVDNHDSANSSNKNQQQDKSIDKKQIVVADFGCGDADLAKQLLKVQIPIHQQQQQQGGAKRQKGGGGSSEEEKSSSSSLTLSSFWCPFCVHSFDLVSQSDLVTACDMSNVPLPSATVDVAIFCLSLMGTNLADFVREAHRVLKSTGRLKIAEVKSRFSSSTSSSSTTTTKSSNNKSSKNSRNIRNQKNNSNNNATEQDDEEREFIHVLKQLGFECMRTDRSNKMFVLFELRKNGKTPNPKVEYTAKPCIYKRR